MEREGAARSEERGEGADRIGRAARGESGRGVHEHAGVGRPSFGKGLDQTSQLVACAVVLGLGETGGRAVEFGAGRQRRPDLGGPERRDVDDLKLVRRVAEHAQRAGRVARGQHETVAVGGKRRDEVAQDGAQAGEALEGPQLQELVEEERRRRIARGTRGAEPGERGVERRPGSRIRAHRGLPGLKGERRRHPDRLEQPLRRRGDALDVDVLAGVASEQIAQRARATTCARYHSPQARREFADATGSAFERGEYAPLEGRTLRNHHCAVPPAAGMSMPWRRAVSIASG